MKPRNLAKKKEKENVYSTVSELCNEMFENYYDGNDELSDAKKDKLDQKFKPITFKHKDYDIWFTEE